MRPARRRVARQRQRNQAEQRSAQQDRGPGPTQHRGGGQSDRQGEEGGPPPRVGGVDQTGYLPEGSWFEVVPQRFSGDVGNSEGHQQRGADRPHHGRPGCGADGPVPRSVENSAVLRRHQERRQEETSDCDHRGDLPHRPDERQADRGDRPRVGQARRGERVGKRQCADTGGHQSGEHRNRSQQRPKSCSPRRPVRSRDHAAKPRATRRGQPSRVPETSVPEFVQGYRVFVVVGQRVKPQSILDRPSQAVVVVVVGGDHWAGLHAGRDRAR